MEQLTGRQREVLAFITSFIETRGFPPTLRDIAGHLKVNGTLGVMRHLEALERKGYIRRDAGSSRGIAVTAAHSAVTLPVVGAVRAGALHPAIEDIQGYFSVDRSQVRGEGSFFLRVRGDSMINAGIFDGDLALVRPQPTADNRDTVVVMVDGEATLKWFYREADHIRLQPANPNMEPIIVAADREILVVGKVIGIYRPLE